MRKITGVLLALAMLIAFCGISFAEVTPQEEVEHTKNYVKFLQDKLAKVETYKSSLNVKFNQAGAVKDWKKAKKIKTLLLAEQKKAQQLKVQLAKQENKLLVLAGKKEPAGKEKIQVVEVKTAIKPLPEPKKGWVMRGGLSGGAGALELGYVHPISERMVTRGEVGYGVGNNYSIILVQASGIYTVNSYLYAGFGVDLGNFSKRVINVIGASDIPKGNKIGVGVFVGSTLGKVEAIQAEIGISSALGLTLMGKYSF